MIFKLYVGFKSLYTEVREKLKQCNFFHFYFILINVHKVLLNVRCMCVGARMANSRLSGASEVNSAEDATNAVCDSRSQ